MILAGDIGGTHCRLALFSGPRALKEETVLPSSGHESFAAAARAFIGRGGAEVEAACLGVAGPVLDGRAKIHNLPWVLDAARLRGDLGVPRVVLINDLEANAYGMEWLEDKDYFTLQTGRPVEGGNQALIAAGTGLGEAGLIRVEGRTHVCASEGGHVDFAPADDLQVGLMKHLQREFRRVSYQMILSGPGFLRVYGYLKEAGPDREPDWLAREMAGPDPARALAQAGLEGKCPLAERALSLFLDIYGAETGNTALKFLSTGGVFIGGGIAPALLPAIRRGGFMEAFLAKDRVRGLLEGIPVKVILNDKAALLGAACHALRTALP